MCSYTKQGAMKSKNMTNKRLRNPTAIVNLYVEKRLVHRDISPRNLILSYRDWTGGRRVGKLIDFEYAKNVDELTEEDAALRVVRHYPFVLPYSIQETSKRGEIHPSQ